MPKFPRNGMVIAPKTEHGMKARFRCKDGFELKGYPIVVCSFGNWSGETPQCEECEYSIASVIYYLLLSSQHFPPLIMINLVTRNKNILIIGR